MKSKEVLLQNLKLSARRAEQMGLLPQSEILLERALGIAARVHGENTVEYANLLLQTANTAGAQGKWKKTEDYYLDAIQILKSTDPLADAALYAGLAAQMLRQQLASGAREMAS